MYPLFSTAIWGAMFAVLAGALRHIDPANLTAIRYGSAASIMCVALVLREGARALRMDGRGRELLLLGGVGFAGFNLLLVFALRHTAAQNAALLFATAPLLTTLVRWVRDGVRPRASAMALIAVALAGAALVITKGRLDHLGRLGSGDLMMLAGILCWAVYTHGVGRFGAWSPLRFSALSAAVGAAVLIGVAAAADLTGWERLPAAGEIRAAGWQLGYIIPLGSVLAVVAWAVGVRRMGAPNAALFQNLIPVVAFTVAAARGYHPAPAELTGGAITVLAIVAANLAGRHRPPAVAAAAPGSDSRTGTDPGATPSGTVPTGTVPGGTVHREVRVPVAAAGAAPRTAATSHGAADTTGDGLGSGQRRSAPGSAPGTAPPPRRRGKAGRPPRTSARRRR